MTVREFANVLYKYTFIKVVSGQKVIASRLTPSAAASSKVAEREIKMVEIPDRYMVVIEIKTK